MISFMEERWTLPELLKAQQRRVAWIPTVSGRVVDLLDPDPRDIDIEDIATHLARQNRFTGGTLMPYTVAQHSVLVANLCRRPRAGLLHDAHEAYLGDWSRPLQRALALLGAGEALTLLKARFDRAICIRFGLEIDALDCDDIHHADRVLLATETRDVLIEGACIVDELPPPQFERIVPCSDWLHAREMFLNRFEELTA